MPERITSHFSRVSFSVFLDRRTLAYLASEADGSGPWLYTIDVERRIPHRISAGLDRYTSLSASADGRRLVVTLDAPKTTLWRLRIGDWAAQESAPTRIPLNSSSGFSPRLGPDYLLYNAANGANESIWKLAQGGGIELWRGKGAKFVGGPAISFDGCSIAFSVRQQRKALLYVMQADGTNARVVCDRLNLQGAPAWAPDGELLVYSGPDVATKFSVKAVSGDGSAKALPEMMLTRGARHLAFLPGGRSLVLLRGAIQHKNLWLVDLQSGKERQLTDLSPDFEMRDFDVSPDGNEVVLERVQERSDVVLLDLERR